MKRLLAIPISALLLASSTVLTDSQQHWARAFAGHAQASFQVGQQLFQQQRKSEALFWWKKAAQNGSLAAVEGLLREFPEQRHQWLALAANQGHEAAIVALAQAQLTNNHISWQRWQQRWLSGNNATAVLQRWPQLDAWQKSKPGCKEVITVTGRRYSDKARFVKRLGELTQAPLPTAHWCFTWQLSEPDQQPAQNQDIHGRQIQLTAHGKAFAHGNRISLSQDSSAKVFYHELGHWLGLADEYAMSAELATKFCHGHYQFDALNIVVTENDQLSTAQLQQLWRQLPWHEAVPDWKNLAQPLPNGRWQLGTLGQGIGLHKAKTCDQIDSVQAWKATPKVTAMEQHQTAYWPPLYLALITQRLMAN